LSPQRKRPWVNSPLGQLALGSSRPVELRLDTPRSSTLPHCSSSLALSVPKRCLPLTVSGSPKRRPVLPALHHRGSQSRGRAARPPRVVGDQPAASLGTFTTDTTGRRDHGARKQMHLGQPSSPCRLPFVHRRQGFQLPALPFRCLFSACSGLSGGKGPLRVHDTLFKHRTLPSRLCLPSQGGKGSLMSKVTRSRSEQLRRGRKKRRLFSDPSPPR
jgi:hypothetical protein